jgi:RNA polymerase sigma factor (sigma-70 family)
LEDARKAQVVELRFFGGLSIEETAQALGISARTVHSDWTFARAWLYRKLSAIHAH